MKIRRRFGPGVGWNVFVFPGVKWNLFVVLCAFVFGPLDRSKADVTEVSDMLSSSTPPPTELGSGSEDESQPVVEGDSQPSVEDVSPHKEKEQKEALKPLGLAKHRPVWQKVEVKTSGVNVRGGFNRKFDIAPSLVYNIGEEQHAFVQLSKNHSWFLRGVGGCNTKKGDLKALAVFADIRKAYYAAEEDAAVAELAAVAESEPDDSDGEDDPMNCLDAPAQPTAVPKARGRPKATAKPKGRPKRKAQSLVRTFPMPKHPACSGWDPAVAGGEIDIHVYKKKTKTMDDGTGCGNATCLYLRADNISWLLQYAADELLFQGVQRYNEEEAKKTCNSAVAGLHLDWDFEKKAWTATFVDGVHVGTTKRFAAEQLTKEHCKKMIALSMIDRKTNDQKHVSEQFITFWCQAIVDNKGGEFEKEWDLSSDQANKKRRCGNSGRSGGQ